MRKFTKVLLSLMLMFGLTTSSFAAQGTKAKKSNNRPKIEQKMYNKGKQMSHRKDIHKKEVKVVKVYKKPHHKHHHHHHRHHKHHNKAVYYSSNNSNDFAVACMGTGLCLAVLAAAINS